MSQYQKVKLHISKGQTDKIKKAIQEQSDVSIRLSHSDLEGEHILALTQSQLNKIAKAYEKGTGVTLKLSKKQLAFNAKVEGGFIGALLPLLVVTILLVGMDYILKAVKDMNQWEQVYC